MSERTRILILSANPIGTDLLELNEEYRRIHKLLRSSPLGKNFEIIYYPESRATELLEVLVYSDPHIIHFSGHGEDDSLVFTDDNGKKSHFVTKNVLAKLFELCQSNLQAVVLNACYSAEEADSMVAKVPFLVGMNADIQDEAAIRFAEGFYSAIFKQATLDISHAYDVGLIQMGVANIAEKECRKPVLRRPPFIPSCKHDVLICFADDDKEWTHGFSESLKTALQKELCPDGYLEFCTRSDLEHLESAAVVLLVTSPAFLQAQMDNLHRFRLLAQRDKAIFLIEIKPIEEMPRELLALECCLFWFRDKRYGCITLQFEDEYKQEIGKLAIELANELRALKNPKQKAPPAIIIPTPTIIIPPPPPAFAHSPEMVIIPAGSFKMGSNDFYIEKPIHTVNIKKFEIGKYPVTQWQWEAVMGNNPSCFTGNSNLPVENVSWNDAQEYIKKLNQLTGKNYRLPSESEWEYAGRGGKRHEYCGSDIIDKVAWYVGNSDRKTHTVGQKQPNGFGLYDMSGNVWEWVEDYWHDNYKDAPDDGTVWATGGVQEYRVLRGGSWNYNDFSTRATNRDFSEPTYRCLNYGFRVARTVP